MSHGWQMVLFFVADKRVTVFRFFASTGRCERLPAGVNTRSFKCDFSKLRHLSDMDVRETGDQVGAHSLILTRSSLFLWTF